MEYLNPILGHFINPSGLGTWTQIGEEGESVPLKCDWPGFSHFWGAEQCWAWPSRHVSKRQTQQGSCSLATEDRPQSIGPQAHLSCVTLNGTHYAYYGFCKCCNGNGSHLFKDYWVNELGQCLAFTETQFGTSRQVARVRKEPEDTFEEVTLRHLWPNFSFCFPKLMYLTLFSAFILTPLLRLNIPSR